MNKKLNIAVTGAFGYSGKYITKRLLSLGYHVRTLTNSKNKPNPFGEQIDVYPLNFHNESALRHSLSSVDVLINTYWVRFNHKKFNHHDAVQNTKVLFNTAKAAGVKRIIHVSITNPSIASNLEYFHGKAELEDYLKKMEMGYAIIRPAVIFGKEDILINNIAWIIRKLPVFGVFGKGDYKLQPIYVDDMAELIVNQITQSQDVTINAIGPETFTYKELVSEIMRIIDVKKKIIHVDPFIGYLVGRLLSFFKNDVTITRAEIKGLMSDLLFVNDSPIGKTKLSEWAMENKNGLGKEYANELSRR